MPQLFKPFYRIEKSINRDTGGRGFGLYLVKQVFETLSISNCVKNVELGVKFSL
jgi:two-component system sensor histidine kinase VanS